MTGKYLLFFMTGIMMFAPKSFSQSLFAARSIGLAAYGAAVTDSREFDGNPAGLVRIRDWDFNVATYFPVKGSGFVFQGISFGKRFLENQAVAFKYSPGSVLEFIIPSTLSLIGTPSAVNVDTRITYEEPFSFAYAHRLTDYISLGVGGRMRQEKITDTRYEFITQDSITFARPVQHIEQTSSVNIDFGLYWQPHYWLTISALGRSLVVFKDRNISGDLQNFQLPSSAMLELGAAVNVSPNVLLAGQMNTKQYGALGYEVRTGFGFTWRNGIYFNKRESPFVYGVSAGLGWSYEFLDVDVGYVRFLSRGSRSGTASLETFDRSSIYSLDLNAYTGDRVALSVKAIFGNIRESLARIESVEMLDGVYPSSYEVFAYRPLGKVRVRNISGKPIQAKASFFVEKYMDSPTLSSPVSISPGEEMEIPFNAVFNENVKHIPRMTIRDGNIYVSATTAEEYDDRHQTRVLIYGKNDWNGDVYTLRYFVRPDDPDILGYTRDVLLQNKDSLSNSPAELEAFLKAKLLFNTFAGKLVYVNDPKHSSDYVQYPAETLRIRGGDCDDMTVCFASLLSSVGISTAFVDVVPPDRPEQSHIYMLFDSGLDPKFGRSISENPKRYVVRRNKKGLETIWVPIETTAITKGFDEAWTAGAQAFFDDVEVGLGLIRGWVKIVDVY